MQVTLSDFIPLKLFNITIILYALPCLSSLNNYCGIRQKTYYLLHTLHVGNLSDCIEDLTIPILQNAVLLARKFR